MENANKDTYTLGLDFGFSAHARCLIYSTREVAGKANGFPFSTLQDTASTAFTTRFLPIQEFGLADI